MKISRILFITMAALIGQQVYAEKFQIINQTKNDLACVAKLTSFQWAFKGTITAGKATSPIDIGDKKLLLIEWTDNGTKYFADFEQYSDPGTLAVPLQQDRKNFFNIYQNGFYSHNFNGQMNEGRAANVSDNI